MRLEKNTLEVEFLRRDRVSQLRWFNGEKFELERGCRDNEGQRQWFLRRFQFRRVNYRKNEFSLVRLCSACLGSFRGRVQFSWSKGWFICWRPREISQGLASHSQRLSWVGRLDQSNFWTVRVRACATSTQKADVGVRAIQFMPVFGARSVLGEAGFVSLILWSIYLVEDCQFWASNCTQNCIVA